MNPEGGRLTLLEVVTLHTVDMLRCLYYGHATEAKVEVELVKALIDGYTDTLERMEDQTA